MGIKNANLSDYAHATVAMRLLLGKGKTFLWTASQEFEFKTLKTLLTKKMQTNHFDPSRDVHLLIDASCHFGLGFALIDHYDLSCKKRPH